MDHPWEDSANAERALLLECTDVKNKKQQVGLLHHLQPIGVGLRLKKLRLNIQVGAQGVRWDLRILALKLHHYIIQNVFRHTKRQQFLAQQYHPRHLETVSE